MIPNGISEAFSQLLEQGFTIRPTSCLCGGWWAWVDPDGTMVGCICHHHPIAILKRVEHYMPSPSDNECMKLYPYLIDISQEPPHGR